MSLHAGTWQTPAEHTPLTQSVPTEHVWPFAQSAGHVPPQSTSVSVAFFTMSLHVGTWQIPAVHTPLTQSPAPTHT
jgi:hypothetical protein